MRHAESITPSDDYNLAQSSIIYVGGEGNLKVVTEGGDTVTFAGVKTGTTIPVEVLKVFDTDTTATLLLACW
jgi:hypothetical protein